MHLFAAEILDSPDDIGLHKLFQQLSTSVGHTTLTCALVACSSVTISTTDAKSHFAAGHLSMASFALIRFRWDAEHAKV